MIDREPVIVVTHNLCSSGLNLPNELMSFKFHGLMQVLKQDITRRPWRLLSGITPFSYIYLSLLHHRACDQSFYIL